MRADYPVMHVPCSCGLAGAGGGVLFRRPASLASARYGTCRVRRVGDTAAVVTRLVWLVEVQDDDGVDRIGIRPASSGEAAGDGVRLGALAVVPVSVSFPVMAENGLSLLAATKVLVPV